MKLTLEQFALAGNATFTVRSAKTGTRFTFRVRKPKLVLPGNNVHFVSVLTGPDNTSQYEYLGTMFNGTDYQHGRRSRVGSDAASATAFQWVWNHRSALDGKVEVFHAGKCCRCGRKLTTPESIEAGYGPECAGKMGMGL